jgi:hypothetical protein
MLDGIHLTLLIGSQTHPMPAPAPVTEALQSVQVTASSDRTVFELTFTVGKMSSIQQVLLPTGLLDPIVTRVVIIVTFRGVPQVIADGVVTRQAFSPSNEPGQTKLTLTCEDLTVLMDLEEKKESYPAMPDQASILKILAQYAKYGIAPLVVPPGVMTVKSPTSGVAKQTDTDLRYIKGLADQCGYIFRLEPGPMPGTSVAYFGPNVPLPLPQPALSVNMDWQTNVESLTFSYDGLAKRSVKVTIFDPITKKVALPVPIPSVSAVHPPLGARLQRAGKKEYPADMAELKTDEAAKRIFGLLLKDSDSVTGNGSLNVTRYGHILRMRTVVGVRGAGLAYDGFYYVNSVTHNLKRGEYKQSFTLSRDGLVSLTPVVGP